MCILCGRSPPSFWLVNCTAQEPDCGVTDRRSGDFGDVGQDTGPGLNHEVLRVREVVRLLLNTGLGLLVKGLGVRDRPRAQTRAVLRKGNHGIPAIAGSVLQWVGRTRL